MDKLLHENITCEQHEDKYNISSSAYFGILIVLKQKPNKDCTSIIDIINNANENFAFIISLFNDKNIEALEIASKNPKFTDFMIINIDNNWQDVINVLKTGHIKILSIRNCYMDTEEASKISPYLDKIDNIIFNACNISENNFKKYLDVCNNIKSLSIYNQTFEYEHVEHILLFIENTKIKELNLSGNIEDGLLAIIYAFRFNKFIKKIYICFAFISSTVLKAYNTLLTFNKTLIDIDTGDEIYNNLITQKLEENRQLLKKRINEIENIGCMLMHSEVKISQNVINEFLQFGKNMLI